MQNLIKKRLALQAAPKALRVSRIEGNQPATACAAAGRIRGTSHQQALIMDHDSYFKMLTEQSKTGAVYSSKQPCLLMWPAAVVQSPSTPDEP